MLFRLFLITLLLVCLSSSQVSGQSCSFSTGGTTYDFSSYTTDFTYSAKGWNYYLHLCGTVTSQQLCLQSQHGNSQASACQSNINQPDGNTYAAGLWSNSVQMAVNAAGNGVTYTMTGVTCDLGGNYQAIINLMCAPQDGTLTATAQDCTQTYTLPLKAACGVTAGGGGGDDDGGSKKLSGGWIFIIILCIVIPLYIIGGCVYKHQKLGAVGIEKCPNIEFWRELPSYVKDGCVFTWTKLRGLCNGGSGGSRSGGNSYETM